ncbi:hypothetical protein CDAR_4391 [Caerostris darwini]|uniref:Uncharacterized protein n=1 Tax=Caerostris darwini TaxID=1538125 RepID=A0AAV4V984_9ARAC|nr:hypothetical protein CDAR_4391 [Caerostris darwini]
MIPSSIRSYHLLEKEETEDKEGRKELFANQDPSRVCSLTETYLTLKGGLQGSMTSPQSLNGTHHFLLLFFFIVIILKIKPISLYLLTSFETLVNKYILPHGNHNPIQSKSEGTLWKMELREGLLYSFHKGQRVFCVYSLKPSMTLILQCPHSAVPKMDGIV